jgi:hypothetical protein
MFKRIWHGGLKGRFAYPDGTPTGVMPSTMCPASDTPLRVILPIAGLSAADTQRLKEEYRCS